MVGPRPERFETCIFSEDLLRAKFRQRVVPVALPDIMSRAGSNENPAEIEKIIRSIKIQADTTAVDAAVLRKIAGLEYALMQFAAEKNYRPWAFSAGQPCNQSTDCPPVTLWEA
jgi:hypothetical protein